VIEGERRLVGVLECGLNQQTDRLSSPLPHLGRYSNQSVRTNQSPCGEKLCIKAVLLIPINLCKDTDSYFLTDTGTDTDPCGSQSVFAKHTNMDLTDYFQILKKVYPGVTS